MQASHGGKPARQRIAQGAGLLALLLAGVLAAFAASSTASPVSAQQTTTTGTTTTVGTTTTTTPTTTATTTTTVAAPANTSPPTISGSAVGGQTLTANNGSWTGGQPITFTYQWRRCDQNGANCANIVGATGQTYTLTTADVGRTLRVAVSAANAGGTTTATSAQTAVVRTAGPAGQIRLPNGRVSIPAASVELPARLIIDGFRFNPNPVRSRQVTITMRVHVSDTRGFAVRGALVFVRSTPLLTTTPAEQATRLNGWVTFRITPFASFPLRTGYNVQFFVRARKAGDNVLAGVSTRRLVQVRTGSPR